MRNRANLLGYEIDTFNFEDAVNYAKQISGQVVTINPEMMSNEDLIDIINNSELVIPDGIGVEIGLKLAGYDVKRIAGISFSYKLLEECAKDGKPVALIGAKSEVVEKAVKNLSNEIKDLNVVYFQDGYFIDDNEIIDCLVKYQPRLVLCALGSPKQEFFINNAKKGDGLIYTGIFGFYLREWSYLTVFLHQDICTGT